MTSFESDLPVWHDVLAIRERTPLIVNITNYVVTNTTANALLALGASPAMSHAVDEIAEFTAVCGALVINLGSLTDEYIDAMLAAGATAAENNVPVVLDPVAAAASSLRRETVARLLDSFPVAVIRGNASEILFLAGQGQGGRGVDATDDSTTASGAARELARKYECAVCVSGETDVVTDGTRMGYLKNGHEMMPLVTGLGCTSTAIIGAFAAVNSDPFYATLHGAAYMGVCGQRAARASRGPGSLQMNLYNELYAITPGELEGDMRLEVVS